MLEGPINVGKKYIWNPPSENTHNLEVLPMAVLTVLGIHSYTIANRTWIEFEDDQGKRTSMDSARFRQGCLETNQYIGKIETLFILIISLLIITCQHT